jgi:hypothetical protein
LLKVVPFWNSLLAGCVMFKKNILCLSGCEIGFCISGNIRSPFFVTAEQVHYLCIVTVEDTVVDKSWATKFCTLAWNICGSTILNLLQVIHLVPRIFVCLLDFCKIC